MMKPNKQVTKTTDSMITNMSWHEIARLDGERTPVARAIHRLKVAPARDGWQHATHWCQ